MTKENELEKTDKYKKPNSLTRAFYKTSALGQKLFCYSLFCATNSDFDFSKGVIKFSVSDFAKALCVSRSGQGYINIKNAINEIYDFNIIVKDDDKKQELKMFRVFQSAEIEKNQITLQFSSPTIEILEKHQKKQYSLLALNQIAKLKNFYAIRLYEIALSWSGQKGKVKGRPQEWFFDFTFEEFKSVFQLEDMRSDNIVNRVVKKPVEEINKNTNLEISCDIEQERKQPPKKFRFWCKFKDSFGQYPLTVFDIPSVIEPPKLDEDKLMYRKAVQYKELHLDEWTVVEKTVKERLDKIYGSTTMQVLVDIETYKELMSKKEGRK